MKKITQTFAKLGTLVVALGVMACVNDPAEGATQGGTDGTPIEIAIGEENRALLDLSDGKSVTWEEGDKIGVIYHVDGVASANAANIPYEATSSGNSVTFTGNGSWEGSASNTHDFYVYFPYRDRANTADKIVLSMATKQTYDATADDWDLGSQYSFSYAKVKKAEYGKPIQIGTMKQYLGVLRYEITNNTSSDLIIEKVTTTCTASIASSHRVDLTGDKVVGEDKSPFITEVVTTVEHGSVDAGETLNVRLALIPRDYSSKTFTVTIETDTGVHPAVEFKGGVIAEGGSAVKAISLEPLAPVVPDNSLDVASLKFGDKVGGGMVYAIADDKSYAYVLHPSGEKKMWAAVAADTPGATDVDDGTVNVAAMKANVTSSFAEDFPAAAYCESLGEGFYMPAPNELKALGSVYLADKDAFDAALKAAFGESNCVVLDPDGASSVWASTQSSNKPANGQYIKWASGNTMQANSKTNIGRYARCIRKIENGASILPDDSTTEPEEDLDPISDEYDVFLLIGQSNMAGRGTMIEGDDAVIDGVYLLNGDDAPEAASNPLNKYSTISKGLEYQQINPGFSFSQEIYKEIKASGRKVLLVVNARGGTSIANWLKSSTTTNYYSEAVRRAKEAMRYGTLKAILWHQGESNSSAPSKYISNLTTLVGDLRKDLADVPFVAGEIAPWHKNANNFNPVIQTIDDNIANTDWVSTEGINDMLVDESDPHFGRDGQIELGKRYAEKVLKMVYGK